MRWIEQFKDRVAFTLLQRAREREATTEIGKALAALYMLQPQGLDPDEIDKRIGDRIRQAAVLEAAGVTPEVAQIFAKIGAQGAITGQDLNQLEWHGIKLGFRSGS